MSMEECRKGNPRHAQWRGGGRRMTKSAFAIPLFLLLTIVLLSMNGCEVAENIENPDNPTDSDDPNDQPECPPPQGDITYYSIFFSDEDNGWIVGDGGAIRHSSDGGKTWLEQQSNTYCNLKSVFFIDDVRGFAIGDNRTLISTIDGGNSWYTDELMDGAGSVLRCLHSDSSGNIYFVSDYGEVFCSPDTGETWIFKHGFNKDGYYYLQFVSPEVAFASDYYGESAAYGEEGQTIEQTMDGGLCWSSFLLPSHWAADIFFLNDSVGWVTESWVPLVVMARDSTAIHFTSDGGKTWQRISAFPNEEYLAISIKNVVFTTLDKGWMVRGRGLTWFVDIYRTSDGGKTWTKHMSIEDEPYIRDMYFLDDNTGWALIGDGRVLKIVIN